jgi:hypothetical protein
VALIQQKKIDLHATRKHYLSHVRYGVGIVH